MKTDVAYVFVDDDMPEHPKIEEVGPLGGWLHFCAIAYCNRHLTDGIFRKRVVRRFDFDWLDDEVDALPDLMVKVGLWHDEESTCDNCPATPEGYYRVHDYLDFQKTRDKVEEQREAKIEAGKKGARARWGKRTPAAPSMADAIAPPMAEPIAPEMAPPMAGVHGTPYQTKPVITSTDVDVSAVVEQPRNALTVMPRGTRPVKARPRDPLWDSVVDAFGIAQEEITSGQRGKLNAAVKQLREINASPEEVRNRVAAYRLMHPTWECTPNAVVAHWGSLTREQALAPQPTKSDLAITRWIAGKETS